MIVWERHRQCGEMTKNKAARENLLSCMRFFFVPACVCVCVEMQGCACFALVHHWHIHTHVQCQLTHVRRRVQFRARNRNWVHGVWNVGRRCFFFHNWSPHLAECPLIIFFFVCFCGILGTPLWYVRHVNSWPDTVVQFQHRSNRAQKHTHTHTRAQKDHRNRHLRRCGRVRGDGEDHSEVTTSAFPFVLVEEGRGEMQR